MKGLEIIVIAHNIRSAHNVGALMRTCEGIGVKKLYFSGYTPFPVAKNDSRLPHIAQKLTKQIQKTSLGAEKTLNWDQNENVQDILNMLNIDGFEVVALEQSSDSISLPNYKPPTKVAVLIGSEVQGIDPALLSEIPTHIEIPMFGKKESYNVVEAASMCLYHMRFAKQ
jgi:tRNA G18 (ribose-2'-O)-methylase SpoU